MITGEVLKFGWPDAQWNWPREGVYEALEWFGPGDKPSWAEIEVKAAEFSDGSPTRPYVLYKSTFVERMTPEEAATFEMHLNAHELAKLRLMYHAVEYFVSDDPLLAVLHWELMQEFGETRADELLAAE